MHAILILNLLPLVVDSTEADAQVQEVTVGDCGSARDRYMYSSTRIIVSEKYWY